MFEGSRRDGMSALKAASQTDITFPPSVSPSPVSVWPFCRLALVETVAQ